MLLGAHVSISGGVQNAPDNGKRIGCDVIQIFSKNQQQWKAKPLEEASVQAFKAKLAEHKLGPTLVHCSYLLNLASPDDALWEKSVHGLAEELERAEALGIPYVVFHPGSPKDKGEDWGCARVAAGISRALALTQGMTVMVLVENNAGAGTLIGDTTDELKKVLDAVTGERHRAGVCIDTCHAYVSGYPIHTAEGYEAYIRELDEKIGLDRVKCFHLNDAKLPFGSRKDRHENIGKGTMGEVGFWKLVTDPRFRDTPGYIETPYESDADYIRDLATLRDLASGKRKPQPAPKVGQMTLGGETAAPAPAAAAKAPKKAPAKKAQAKPRKS